MSVLDRQHASCKKSRDKCLSKITVFKISPGTLSIDCDQGVQTLMEDLGRARNNSLYRRIGLNMNNLLRVMKTEYTSLYSHIYQPVDG